MYFHLKFYIIESPLAFSQYLFFYFFMYFFWLNFSERNTFIWSGNWANGFQYIISKCTIYTNINIFITKELNYSFYATVFKPHWKTKYDRLGESWSKKKLMYYIAHNLRHISSLPIFKIYVQFQYFVLNFNTDLFEYVFY